MPSPTRILYLVPPAPLARELLHRHVPQGCELLLMESEDQAERLRLLAQADVLIVASRSFTAEELAAAPRLRFVHHQGVGWQDRVPAPLLKARGIRLAICTAGTAESVAEHALMLMLACQRHIAFADAELRQGRFHNQALRPRSRLLHGRAVGLIGMGRIAQRLAELLQPFGVRGLYFSPNTRLPAAREAALGFRYAPLETVLAESETISLHLPATPETRHLINRETIARMRPGAFLVNTARGAVVEEAALVEALREGRLGGAGLDVFEAEPPAADNPLFALPNVVVTPHIGAGAADTLRLKIAAIMGNIARFLAGDVLQDEIRL